VGKMSVPPTAVPVCAGWPVRFFVSDGGSAYHASRLCNPIKVGQWKALARRDVVRAIMCVALVDVSDRRRPCAEAPREAAVATSLDATSGVVVE
jgi:hypothetical protein